MVDTPGKRNITPRVSPAQLSDNLSRVLQQAEQAKADADAAAATERGDDGTDAPTADTINRAEVIDQLEAAGLFDRKIIGREPDQLSDSDLNDLVAELARRTFVSEVTGTDIKDVKDTDFGKLIKDHQGILVEDLFGKKLEDMTKLERLVVEQRLRDPEGVPGSTTFSDVIDQIVAGKSPSTQTTPGTQNPTTGLPGQFLGGGTARDTAPSNERGDQPGSGSGGSSPGTDTATDSDADDPFANVPGSGSGSTGDSGQSTEPGDHIVGFSSEGSETVDADGNVTNEQDSRATIFQREDGTMYAVDDDGTVRDLTADEQATFGETDTTDDDTTDETTDDDTTTTDDDTTTTDDDTTDDDTTTDDSGAADSDAAGGGVGKQEGDPGDPDGGIDVIHRLPIGGLLPERTIPSGSVFGSDPNVTDPVDNDAVGVAIDENAPTRVVPGVSNPGSIDNSFGSGLPSEAPSPPSGSDPNVTDPLEGEFNSSGPPKNDDPLQQGNRPTPSPGNRSSRTTDDSADDDTSDDAPASPTILKGVHRSAAQTAFDDARARGGVPDALNDDDPFDPSDAINDLHESDKEAAIARQLGVHPIAPRGIENLDDDIDDPLDPND